MQLSAYLKKLYINCFYVQSVSIIKFNIFMLHSNSIIFCNRTIFLLACASLMTFGYFKNDSTSEIYPNIKCLIQVFFQDLKKQNLVNKKSIGYICSYQ